VVGGAHSAFVRGGRRAGEWRQWWGMWSLRPGVKGVEIVSQSGGGGDNRACS